MYRTAPQPPHPRAQLHCGDPLAIHVLPTGPYLRRDSLNPSWCVRLPTTIPCGTVTECSRNDIVQILYPEKRIYLWLGTLIVIELGLLAVNAIRILPTIHLTPMCTLKIGLVWVLLYG